jgi:hypothetical protein
MANTKISALPASTTPLAGTEVLPIVQSSNTKQVSVANLTAGRAVATGALTVTGAATVSSTLGVTGVATLGAGAILNTPASVTLTSATGLPLTTGVTGLLPIANGGTATATPSIVAGTNITVSGTWPNQTIAASGGGSGTVTSVAASVPSLFSITGSPITTSGTLAMTYSGTALPVANGGTGQTTYTDGQLLIGNTTGNTLTKTTLTAGSGVTITNGTGSITIAASGGSGDVVGPASSTDNAFTRFDGTTGKLIQNSTGATLSDTGAAVFASGAFGTTPSTTGVIRIPNASPIYARNAANSADRHVIEFNSSGEVAINGDGNNTVIGTTVGTLKTATTISVGAATPSTSGAGITFPATQSASTDANTLDDYEEGTWTPTQGAQLTVVGAFSSAGNYIKIGNFVQCRARVTGATSVAITGGGEICAALPFAVNNSPIQAGSAINGATNQTAIVQAYSSSFYAGTAITATAAIHCNVGYSV